MTIELWHTVLIVWLDKGNLKILCGRSVCKCHRHDDAPHILSIQLQGLSSIIKLKRALIREIAKTVRGKVYELFYPAPK